MVLCVVCEKHVRMVTAVHVGHSRPRWRCSNKQFCWCYDSVWSGFQRHVPLHQSWISDPYCQCASLPMEFSSLFGSEMRRFSKWHNHDIPCLSVFSLLFFHWKFLACCSIQAQRTWLFSLGPLSPFYQVMYIPCCCFSWSCSEQFHSSCIFWPDWKLKLVVAFLHLSNLRLLFPSLPHSDCFRLLFDCQIPSDHSSSVVSLHKGIARIDCSKKLSFFCRCISLCSQAVQIVRMILTTLSPTFIE